MSIFFILGISSYFSMPREAFPEINDTKVFVSTIYPGNTAEDIERIATASSIDAIKGQVAGVDIQSAGGRPGQSPVVRIRGRRSLSASNDPLFCNSRNRSICSWTVKYGLIC